MSTSLHAQGSSQVNVHGTQTFEVKETYWADEDRRHTKIILKDKDGDKTEIFVFDVSLYDFVDAFEKACHTAREEGYSI